MIITKHYGDKTVLDHVNIEIAEGKTTLISGPSGAGKTTLSRILMGLEPNEGESVSLPGRLSAVFQEDRLIESFTAEENIRLVSKKSDAEISGMLSLLGLPEGQCVREFSGGMRRRCAIARALMAPFDVLLLDEPFTGLDEDTEKSVIDVIKKHTQGKTVILITHSEKAALEMGHDSVITLTGSSLA
ncbi:MAG: ATP-binding cassette domain-containing protein [Bullifex sp.]